MDVNTFLFVIREKAANIHLDADAEISYKEEEETKKRGITQYFIENDPTV